MRKIGLLGIACILTASMLLIMAFSPRPAPENQGNMALEAPITPTPCPDIMVINISAVTPASVISMGILAAPPSQSPIPNPVLTPDQTATPRPASTPVLYHNESAELEARKDLPEYRDPSELQQAEIEEILGTLPKDLDLSRTLIVLKAYSLLGKVAYQFGGKSSALGWDPIWNTVASQNVMADGTITVQAFGLDCSGYVRWCFINAAGTSYMGKYLGSGTYKQWINSKAIPLAEVLPGDLVFVNKVGRTNHDGIVVQNDGNGTVMVLHTAIGKGIVLESADEGRFLYARRPNILRGSNLQTFKASVLRHRNEPFMADLRYLLTIRKW